MTHPDQLGLCVLGDPEKPHKAILGVYVCEGHRQSLSEQLRAIEDETLRLVLMPSLGEWKTGPGSTLASHRSPALIDALVLTDPRSAHLGTGADAEGLDPTPSVLAELHNWARLVREERGLSNPAHVTVTGERDLLTRQLDWCITQPWIDDMASDLRNLLGTLRLVNKRTRRDEGACPRVIDGEPCPGRVRRAKRSQPWLTRTDRCERVEIDTDGGVLHCPVCGAEWATPEAEARMKQIAADDRREAARLAISEARRPRLDDGRPMVTARELSMDTGMKLDAVRKRLQRTGVQPIAGQWYHPDALAGVVA